MFIQDLTQRLARVIDTGLRYQLYLLLAPLFEKYRTCMVESAGLATGTVNTEKVKVGGTGTMYIIKGRIDRISGSTELTALSGTVSNGAFNAFVFSVDGGGTKYTRMGTEGSAFNKVVLPLIPSDEAVIGYALINPTGTGDFIGGTTPMADATVVPNVRYGSPTGAMDHSVKL